MIAIEMGMQLEAIIGLPGPEFSNNPESLEEKIKKGMIERWDGSIWIMFNQLLS